MATPVHEAPAAEPLVVATPFWVRLVRKFQFVLAAVILGLSAWITHSIYFDEVGLALATCVITWIIVVYARVTERVPSCRGAYNIWAILALDLFAVILWLSAMAAVAAKRAAFVTIRSSFFRRYYIVFLNKTGLDVLSAIAGLSAAELVMFVATFAYMVTAYLKARKGTTAPSSVPAAAPAVEAEPKSAAAGHPQYPAQPDHVYQPQPAPEYTH